MSVKCLVLVLAVSVARGQRRTFDLNFGFGASSPHLPVPVQYPKTGYAQLQGYPQFQQVLALPSTQYQTFQQVPSQRHYTFQTVMGHGLRAEGSSDTQISPSSDQENLKTIIVTKSVPVPYTVQIEKKVPIPIKVPIRRPYAVFVPKPYYVEIPKPVPVPVKVPVPQAVTIEKQIPVAYKVPVDKPYPVQVPKPYPVVIEKKVPVPVEKHIPVQVKVPVERPVPVHFPVEKHVPYPVEKPVPVPYKVTVERPVPYSVEKPVPVQVERHVPLPVHIHVPVPMYSSQQHTGYYQAASNTEARKVAFSGSPSDPVTPAAQVPRQSQKVVSFLPSNSYNSSTSIGTIHVASLREQQSGGSSSEWEPSSSPYSSQNGGSYTGVSFSTPSSVSYSAPSSGSYSSLSTGSFSSPNSGSYSSPSSLSNSAQSSGTYSSPQYQALTQQQGNSVTVSHGTPNYQYTFSRQYSDALGSHSHPVATKEEPVKVQNSLPQRGKQQPRAPQDPEPGKTSQLPPGDILKINQLSQGSNEQSQHQGHPAHYGHQGFPNCCPHMNPYSMHGYPSWPGAPYQQYPQTYNPYPQEVRSQVPNPLDTYPTTPVAPASHSRPTTPVNRIAYISTETKRPQVTSVAPTTTMETRATVRRTPSVEPKEVSSSQAPQTSTVEAEQDRTFGKKSRRRGARPREAVEDAEAASTTTRRTTVSRRHVRRKPDSGNGH